MYYLYVLKLCFNIRTGYTDPRFLRICRVDMRHGMTPNRFSHHSVTVAIKISVKRHTPTSHWDTLPYNYKGYQRGMVIVIAIIMIIKEWSHYLEKGLSSSWNNLIFHSEKTGSDVLSPFIRKLLKMSTNSGHLSAITLIFQNYSKVRLLHRLITHFDQNMWVYFG